MRVRLIVSPYDSGQHLQRMGCGPDRLLDRGLVSALEAAGHVLQLYRIELDDGFPSEIAGGFAAMRAVAREVRSAVESGAFPVVLAGNCNTTVGAVAGLGVERTGVLWLDAHGDINTPDSTATGFLDGMGVAILTGHAWTTVARSIPGFAPLREDCMILAGTRDLDAEEEALLARSGVIQVGEAAIRVAGAEAALGTALADLAGRVGTLHLHLDLDVHDPDFAPANHFRPPGGLSTAEVAACIETAVDLLPLGSLAVTAYDPSVDPTGITADAAVTYICRSVEAAARPSATGVHTALSERE
ncbi:arginase family protein [Algihabitans albus]|uniref:arginase family protein n=1 Tax=Algihabitans albus TaxID=2164067 RepID=UPI000E5D1C32|nr:arginase family protein [Algihabitans albus]